VLVSRRAAKPRGDQAGVTLVELMVVVSMLAIVSAIAVPGFRSVVGTMGAKSAAFDLIADLSMARSEAIRRNAQVEVRPASGTGWATGWSVVALVPGEEPTDPLTEMSLRERPALRSPLEITGTTPRLTFLASGRVLESGNGTLLKWTVKSSVDGVLARCVVITPTGSARAGAGACA
jgi:type IV fimbrial biogenesis protein FimT